MEATFLEQEGVEDTKVGYTGGSVDSPTYKQVCSGNTGHAEACEVQYDPEKVSFEELLNIFFWAHDPTQLNRQGPDVGTQYRSAIFFHDKDQENSAKKLIEELNNSGKFDRPIVTEVMAVQKFWDAEDYHQRYFEKNKNPICRK